MDGRQFDDSKVKATYVTEADFIRASGGEWISQDLSGLGLGMGLLPGMMLPGPPPMIF